MKGYAGFDLDDLRETIARRFVFSVMFPALPKEWRPVIKDIASTIGQLIDEDVEIERFNAKNQNTPIVRLLGHSNMVLPSSIRLPPLLGGKVRVQKITYAGLPNQCFKCRLKIVRGRMSHVGIVMKNLGKKGLPKERRIGLW